MTLRRKRLPAELVAPAASFEDVLTLLGAAKDALTEVMPSTRSPGAPLAEALLTFEEILGGVAERMAGWRAPAVDEAWRAADEGLRTSLERARALREDPPELGGFEGLIWVVGELLDPLDAFEDAAMRFRDLRTRSSPPTGHPAP
jgi:hypothetical protein